MVMSLMKRIQSVSWLLIAIALCAWVGLQWFATFSQKRFPRHTLHFFDGLTYRLDTTTGYTEVIVALPIGPIFLPVSDLKGDQLSGNTIAAGFNYLATRFRQRDLAYRLQTIADLQKKGIPLYDELLKQFRAYDEELSIEFEPDRTSDAQSRSLR